MAGGGSWRGFSSAWSVCDSAEMGEGARRWTAAAGTAASIATGAVSLAALRLFAWRRAEPYGGLWLFAAICLLSGAGELMSLPLFHFGDWAEVLHGPMEGPAARGLGCAVGVALAAASLAGLRTAIAPLLADGDTSARVRDARWLCWLPFLAVGCGLMSAVAFLNVLGLHHALPTALSTVGSTSLLIWIPFTVESVHASRDGRRLHPMEERRALWLLGVAVAVFALLALGPGIPLNRP